MGWGPEKRDDRQTVPMCRPCHRERTDGKLLFRSGFDSARMALGFKEADQATMRTWCSNRVIDTQNAYIRTFGDS